MIELHITYNEETGNVNVNGPIANKGLCYLMLECAKDAVKDHVDRMQQLKVVAPDTNGLPAFVRKAIRKRR